MFDAEVLTVGQEKYVIEIEKGLLVHHYQMYYYRDIPNKRL